MTSSVTRRTLLGASAAGILGALLWLSRGLPGSSQPPPDDLASDFTRQVRPLLQKYCLACHSTKAHKGDLDLERFTSLDSVRKDLHSWQQVADQLEIAEMPPRGKPQPTDRERTILLRWVRALLDAEARARAGDPGPAALRRLNNAEYTHTLRDLTGVELDPAREFPPDSAAGEGFTNTAETLAMSPALIDRYLKAARDVAAHAVLLPDGFRFSPSTSRRDWTNEALAELRKAYAPYPADGSLPLIPYLRATLKHREALKAGTLDLEKAAAGEKLSPKYLRTLWTALTDPAPSDSVDAIRARWRGAGPKDAEAVTAEIARWQASLWKTARVGSYVNGISTRPRDSLTRQVANDPEAREVVAVRVAVKPAPGQSEVVLALVARDVASPASRGKVIWQRPRIEGKGRPPLLLRDYAAFGPAYEIDYPAFFRDAAKYLAAVAEAAHDRKASARDLATRHALVAARLQRWIQLVALEPLPKGPGEPKQIVNFVPAAPLTRLQEPTPKDTQRPAIKGWRGKGADLPVVLSNASDRVEMIPGTVRPHQVAVHPTPTELVGVAWKSPVAGTIRVAGQVTHAHPACGNGVAWWLEHRHGGQAATLSQGALDLGGTVHIPSRTVKLAKGDALVLLIDARNGNHICDLTAVGLTISEAVPKGRVWDLGADVADSIQAANPHADRHGNQEVWSFVKGPARPSPETKGINRMIPPGSLLARWREAAADPGRQAEAARLAGQVQTLLAGPRPGKKDADTALYDALLAADGPLFRGLNLARLPRLSPGMSGFGLPKERFGAERGGPTADDASLVAQVNSITEVRLPAALLREREVVVEGRLAPGTTGVVQFTVAPAAPSAGPRWDGTSPVAAAPDSPALRRLRDDYAAFRRVFPLFVCFPKVVPDDEVVCLKMFHREDEPLLRLLLDDAQARRLDRLWTELRFVSRQPVAEYAYLPQFIGFTTQDTPKELQQFFIDRQPLFKKKAEAFEAEEGAAIPAQLKALLAFADRAYRRPLREDEKRQLLALHAALRKKGVSHDEAFRTVLARVLVSPHFLYRIETPPAGAKPAPVSDLELATRLSYFLWASMPDPELRRLAQAGQLRDLKTLTAQAERLLKSPRVRGLATEFGMQWLQIRDIREHREKNEKLFPTFDGKLREAFFEEAALLFQDLFQNDRSVLDLLDGDDVYVNETLARHYGLTDVKGPEWRKRGGAGKIGRGGVLTLAAVLTRQAGASRTSPILRGNWIVQTLLGEKLPRPPPSVPQLPEGEDTSKLSVRQLVEQHTRDSRCAHCHLRIDPFGFALEGYDPIGRRRQKDLAGRPVDTRATLRGGATFDGFEGLRRYLLKERREDFLRIFCRKLVGYALGRSVTLADQPLVEDMLRSLRAHDYRVSAAVLPIVQSTQFRYLRGTETARDKR
jgi:hypothetical protein